MIAKRKQDSAPMKMVVDRAGGRLGLFPRTAYDEERLNSYRIRTEVNVRTTLEKQHPLIVKWHVILKEVVENARTPWKTAEEASEDIKLALGMTAKVKNDAGNWEHHTISLSDVQSDDELHVYFDMMLDVVFATTGLDVETLKEFGKKKAPITNVEPPADASSTEAGESSEPSAPPPAEAAAGGGSQPLPATAAYLLTEDLMRECIRKMLDVVARERPNEPQTKEQRMETLVNIRPFWDRALSERQSFVTRVHDVCVKVLNGDATRQKAEQYLEGLVR